MLVYHSSPLLERGEEKVICDLWVEITTGMDQSLIVTGKADLEKLV